MSDNLVTPFEQVTAGYWWLRNVYQVGDLTAPSKPPPHHRGPWEIVMVRGNVPFLYIGRWYPKGNDLGWDPVLEPGRIEFGRKIEEMPEGA